MSCFSILYRLFCAEAEHVISCPFLIGALLTFYGYVTYTSSKSVEVQVLVEGECPFIADWQRYRAVESNFVFVSLDENMKVRDVPQLKVRWPQIETYMYCK